MFGLYCVCSALCTVPGGLRTLESLQSPLYHKRCNVSIYMSNSFFRRTRGPFGMCRWVPSLAGPIHQFY